MGVEGRPGHDADKAIQKIQQYGGRGRALTQWRIDGSKGMEGGGVMKG